MQIQTITHDPVFLILLGVLIVFLLLEYLGAYCSSITLRAKYVQLVIRNSLIENLILQLP